MLVDEEKYGIRYTLHLNGGTRFCSFRIIDNKVGIYISNYSYFPPIFCKSGDVNNRKVRERARQLAVEFLEEDGR